MDLHAEHIPSFYDFPVRHLTARNVLAEAIQTKVPDFAKKCVVVGPDLGSAKLVASYADEFESSFALIQKRRLDAKHVETLSIVGEVNEKNVLLADDMCSTGVTMAAAARVCKDCGIYQEKGDKTKGDKEPAAKKKEESRIFAVATHGLLVDDAMKRIEASPIETLVVSNSVAIDKEVLSSPKLCVVSVAPIFAACLSDLTHTS
jgi:ribose-phosphate pyrophosphokinase